MKGELALKIDFNKAYDKVDWGFMRGLPLAETNNLMRILKVYEVASGQEINLTKSEDKHTAGMFAMLVWVLWNNRNNKVWNNTNESGRNLGFIARHLWEEWYSVQQLQHNSNSNAQQQQIMTWQKPNYGWYKCNVDAGFHKNLNRTSFGWCLRDHAGHFVMAETRWMEGSCSIIESESIALLKAMEELRHRGIINVIFETDSKSVVDAIYHLRGGSSELAC
ncbi:hypothetical protein TSUD_301640 [Trifolium subterraneum]|uniref:RNase H type-1 domain-containing protein n=1 Tax=Trifolium subterraneum TaxID=3900 RepID=A0A2Z6PB79_TRISU|nr:hypothetical protein TSUD_301640 [Trifolium subterraneum]